MTTHVRAADLEERWLLYDASEHNLGRMATSIAMALMGKDRPTYTASELCGARVVVINGDKPRFSRESKRENKVYRHYSGYQGGMKAYSIDHLVERRPHEIVQLAVRRMLPKNRLGQSMLKRMKVYAGASHPHTAQQPIKVEKV